LSLIEHTIAAFEREGILDIRVVQGQHRRTNQNAAVQIASAQTLARREIPPADIAIIGECHLRLQSITDWIADPEWRQVPFIGLSATFWSKGLGKTYGAGINDRVDDLGQQPRLVGVAQPGPSS
jgi:DNA repair protein RadD